MALTVGKPAPDFTLKSSKMEDVHLADHRGKNVLLLFIPLAFTPTWTKEFGIVESRLAEIKKANAEVFGISADSPFSLAKWAEQEGYTFPLLSDFGKGTTDAYGVLNPDVRGIKGVPKRSAFLVDKQGNLAAMELVETPGTLPDLDGLIAKLTAK